MTGDPICPVNIMGVQALILDEQPLAFYTHCFSHSLNLCLSKACEVSSIKNMNGIIGTIATFFSYSAKRMDKLKHFIDTGNSNKSDHNTKKTKLKKLCETRWIDRHDSLITFKELYIYIISTLEHLEKYDTNPETSTKASLYVSAITKSDFLVSLEVAVTCFSYTIQLSQVLQSKQQDLSKALNDVMIVREALEAIREDADKSFKEIMKNVTTIASELEIEIHMPRCGRQTARNNVNAKDAEEYFKIVIFIPFLDNLILQLHSRFDKRLETIIPLEGLIPSNLSHYDDQAILAAASIYEDDFLVSMNICLKAELFIWRNQWQLRENLPETAVEAIQHCTELFPNIKKILQLFPTLPVTSATPERTFSVLKRLKTYLRATMNEERLNGLALATINKDELEYENIEKDIMTAFINKSPRRMKVVDWT